jgi:hypothetical protein
MIKFLQWLFRIKPKPVSEEERRAYLIEREQQIRVERWGNR